MRLNQPEMVDDDLGIGIAADQFDALVEPPGNVQVDRQRRSRGLFEHAIKTRIGGVRASPLRTKSMRTPTAPGVRLHSAITSATAGSAGSTGRTSANRSG